MRLEAMEIVFLPDIADWEGDQKFDYSEPD
jgi:hypothetical protein